jgi:hypothetical protein
LCFAANVKRAARSVPNVKLAARSAGSGDSRSLTAEEKNLAARVSVVLQKLFPL